MNILPAKLKHLPNAIHINDIMVSSLEHSDVWAYARETLCGDLNEDYTTLVWSVLDGYELAELIWDIRYSACRGALMALIMHDDSAHLLDSSAEEIKMLHALGHPYAILFLPFAIVCENINRIV